MQVDDLAVANSLSEGAAEDERNPRIDLHIRRQPGPGQIVQRLGWKDRSVVDQDIQTVRCLPGPFDERLILVRTAEIRLNRPCLHAFLLQLLCELASFAVGAVEVGDDVDSPVSESQRHIAADSLRGAGDQGRFAFQFIDHGRFNAVL